MSYFSKEELAEMAGVTVREWERSSNELADRAVYQDTPIFADAVPWYIHPESLLLLAGVFFVITWAYVYGMRVSKYLLKQRDEKAKRTERENGEQKTRKPASA